MAGVTGKKLKERIRVARGEIPADLVLKKGKVLNVFSGTIEECDVAVHEGIIAGIGTRYHGKEEVNTRGKWIAPGFIDAHLHIESSMLLPSNLSAALLPHGTTAIIADPHEIANVLGLDGIRFMIRESEKLPLDVIFMAPSCVPASLLETSGARLRAPDLEELKNEKKILGLAEVMNYPGVLRGDADILSKLALFLERILDGHSPSVSGFDLQAYVSAGIRSDHEASRREEGLEKDAQLLAVDEAARQPDMSIAEAHLEIEDGVGQNQVIEDIDLPDTNMTLFDLHTQLHWRNLWLRGLYAHALVEDAGDLTSALHDVYAAGGGKQGLKASQAIAEELRGFYGEIAYDVAPLVGILDKSIEPFYRYESYDTQYQMPSVYEGLDDESKEIVSHTFGVSYKPIPNLVFKADYQRIRNEARTGTSQWNLAIGYLL